MIRALLVGSQVNWKSKLDATLAEHDIRVDWWWETKNDLGTIPDACDLVLVATDKNSHTLSVPAADRARFSRTKLIHIMHRKAKLVPLPTKCGFPPLHVPIQAPTPVPPTPEVPVNANPTIPPDAKSVLHGAKYHALRGTVERGRYADMLSLLATDPLTPASAISTKMNITPAMVEHVVAAVRETLGISGGRVADTARYETACRALGLTPASVQEDVIGAAKGPVIPPRIIRRGPATNVSDMVPGSAYAVVPAYTGHDLLACRTELGESQYAFAVRIGLSQGTISKAESMSKNTLSTDLRRALHGVKAVIAADAKTATPTPTPAPAPAPTPTTPVTAPAAASPPSIVSLPSTLPATPHVHSLSTELIDVRTALALLREAMRAERVETLIVNASDRQQEIPRQVVAAGKSAVTRLAVVFETLDS